MQLTLKEYEAQYGIKAGTLRQWIFKGKLGAVKLNRDWMVDPEQVKKVKSRIIKLDNP